MESPSTAAPAKPLPVPAPAASEVVRTPAHFLMTYGVQLFVLLLGLALAFM
jgi:hypothetical protein